MSRCKEECGVCHYNHQKIALKIQDIKICYGCIDFFKNLARVENKETLTVIKDQIKYIKTKSK